MIRANLQIRRGRMTALVLAATLMVGWLLSATAAQAQSFGPGAGIAAQAPALGESPVLADLSACLADRKVGDLVLLVDTSGSLGGDTGTDPTAVRVAAAQALLGR